MVRPSRKATRTPSLGTLTGSLTLLGLTFLAGCGPEAPPQGAAEASSSPGRLVIVGGALQRDNAEVYRAVLDGTEGDGPFCIVPTASGVPDESIASAVESFTLHGAGAIDALPITTETAEAASDASVVARIRACSGFWFVGGVQSRVVQVFLPGGLATPAYDAVMERYRAGAVVAGSSAGAAIMSPRMIAGGTSAGALAGGVVERDVADDGDDDGEDDAGGVLIEPGMGFHDGPVYDQHFLARGRIGRLLVATLGGVGGGVGFGIDENTALVVHGRTGQVVGASGVVLVDARGATRDPQGNGGQGVRVHLLGSGDSVDMETYAVGGPAGDKTPLPAAGPDVTVPDDPFARWAFLQFLDAFGRAEVDSATLSSNGYRITVERLPTFRAAAYGSEGVQGTPFGLSVGPLSVSIGPEG